MVGIPPRLTPQIVSVTVPSEIVGYNDYGRAIYGYDENGDPILTDPGPTTTEYPARVDFRERFTRDSAGTQVSVRATVYIAGEADFEPDQKLTMPDGQERPIISSAKILGSRDVVYTQVYTS